METSESQSEGRSQAAGHALLPVWMALCVSCHFPVCAPAHNTPLLLKSWLGNNLEFTTYVKSSNT